MDEAFRQKVISLHGDAGKQWLDTIPSLITQYEKKWNITVQAPYRLNYNYVAPATRADGLPVVLKMRFPQDKEFGNEYRSLQLFDGNGTVKLLEIEKESATLLLEKVEPGTLLSTIKDEAAMMEVLVELIKVLHRPLTDISDFQTLADWGKWFARFRKEHDGTGPFPQELFDKAESIFLEYVNDNKHQFLLHGDIYRNNVLFSNRGWLAIDPRGVVGEREFDTAVLLLSPSYDEKFVDKRKEVIVQRAKQLSEALGMDKTKMLRWALAKSMLTAIWIMYDYNRVSAVDIQNANLLSELI